MDFGKKLVGAFYEKENLLFVTHKNCNDGVGSALVLGEFLDTHMVNLEPHMMFLQYGDEIDFNVFKDKFVVFVDFSLNRKEMENVIELSEETYIIDHHITAAKELDGLPNVIFDISECGCTLFWKTIYPDSELPLMLQYIRDRDIWIKEMPYTEEFTEGLDMLLKDKTDLASMDMINDLNDVSLFITETTKTRYKMKNDIIDNIIKKSKVIHVDFGEDCIVPVINNYMYISEVGNKLCEEYGRVGQWFIPNSDEDKISISFRGSGEYTVDQIAKRFGGGGHKYAAGCNIPITDIGKLLIDKKLV